jgi:FkbM family methyltransferase
MGISSVIQKIRKANRSRLARRRSVKDFLEQERARISCYEQSPIKIDVGTHGGRDFHYRPSSKGDRGVIDQMFVSRDYDFDQWKQGKALSFLATQFAENGVESLIVDAGANIGAAAVFFQQTIAASKLVCIEPDPANFALCEKNLMGTNAVVLKSAISSAVGEVKLFDPGSGDWGFRTSAMEGSDGVVVPSINIKKILELYAGKAELLIVKVDIEGAEADLFAENCSWMDVFPCIIIELHDWMLPRERSSSNFLKQVASRNFDFLHRGENIFLFNMKLIDEKLAAKI